MQRRKKKTILIKIVNFKKWKTTWKIMISSRKVLRKARNK